MPTRVERLEAERTGRPACGDERLGTPGECGGDIRRDRDAEGIGGTGIVLTGLRSLRLAKLVRLAEDAVHVAAFTG